MEAPNQCKEMFILYMFVWKSISIDRTSRHEKKYHIKNKDASS